MPCPKGGCFTAAPRTPVVSFRRPAAPSGRTGPGVGAKSAGRSRSSYRPRPHFYCHGTRRFPCARTRFWHGKSGLEDAFHHSRKTRSQTFHIFSPGYLNDLRPRTPSNSRSVSYSGAGPRKRNLAGMSLAVSPLSATGHSRATVDNRCASRCRRLNHHENEAAATPLGCQTAAEARSRSVAHCKIVFWPRRPPFSDRIRGQDGLGGVVIPSRSKPNVHLAPRSGREIG